jgi:hypothetical protein
MLEENASVLRAEAGRLASYNAELAQARGEDAEEIRRLSLEVTSLQVSTSE